ncbi:hypothetical protein BDN72DRAFT_851485, partial [Pluteus cervinus]
MRILLCPDSSSPWGAINVRLKFTIASGGGYELEAWDAVCFVPLFYFVLIWFLRHLLFILTSTLIGHDFYSHCYGYREVEGDSQGATSDFDEPQIQLRAVSYPCLERASVTMAGGLRHWVRMSL